MKKTFLILLMIAVIAAAVFWGFNKYNPKSSSSAPTGTAAGTVPQESKNEPTPAPIPTPGITAMKVKLYYPDKNAMFVVKEEHEFKTVQAKPETIEIARFCVEQLVKGPDNKGLGNSMPKGTAVRSVVLDKGVLTLDLSQEFEKEHPGGSTGTTMTMSQLVLTLTELPGVEQIAVKIGGNVLSDFKGHMDFSKPFKRSDFEMNIAK